MRNKSDYIIVFAVTLLLTTFLIITIAAAADYGSGFEWKKSTDYTNGTTNNSTVGNPNLDQLGNPAWSYEHFIGLSESWDSSSPMEWMYDWRWGAGGTFVNISRGDQNTQLNTNWNNTGMTSLVRWSNPTGESIDVDITGNIVTTWAGLNWDSAADNWTDYNVASPTDVRVILGYHDFSAGTSSLLIDNTYLSPISEDTICNTWRECPKAKTALDRSLSVDAGDSLFWTTIALDSAPGKNRWLTTYDGGVAITMPAVVPEPVSSALFIVGATLLGIVRFSRKRAV